MSLFVPESRFGIWFLGTEIWVEHVLERALDNLEELIEDRKPSYPIIIDVGCGLGRSLDLLQQRFAPERIIGADIDSEMLDVASARVANSDLKVNFVQTTSSQLPINDQTVDLVFCHQTFHHLVDQNAAIREFYRILKPGGLLLFAESTRAYIHSRAIRLLFRHPMDVQKTANEYLSLIKDAGFRVPPRSVSFPYLWWSRGDLGIMERWFGRPPPEGHEETLLNLVAIRDPDPKS
jgi:SAM-dependent methyltransferase